MQRITRLSGNAIIYCEGVYSIGSVAPGAGLISERQYLGKLYGSTAKIAADLRVLRKYFRVRRDPEQLQTILLYPK